MSKVTFLSQELVHFCVTHQSVGTYKVFVYVLVLITYEGGSYLKRNGYKPLFGRFNGCAEDEIVVEVTNHRTSLLCPRNVPLDHLVPGSPMKKGNYVVILSGDRQGLVAEVKQCQRKKRKVTIITDNLSLSYDFALVCRLTKP
jgi:hypothetical protein